MDGILIDMKKYLFVPTILFISLFITQTLFAQTKPVKAIAEVNIQGAKIANQVGNVLNVSFTLSNGEGVQNGVRYSVRLAPKDKPQIVVDEKVYDEALSLAENSITQKSIIYTTPAGLSGTYAISLVASNSDGFPFGNASVGSATLSATNGAMVVPGSCVLIEKNTKVRCDAQNNTKATTTASPTLSITEGSSFGKEVIKAGSVNGTVITIKPTEKKSFTLDIPQNIPAGPYTVKVSLNNGAGTSNTVTLPLVLSGAFAHILNASLDRDYYTRKDAIEVTLSWSGDGAKSASVRLSSHDITCGSTETALTSRVQAINIPNRISCNNPTLSVSIKDSQGKVLDTQEYQIQTTSDQTSSGKNRIVMIIFVILILFVIVWTFMKNKTVPPVGMVSLLFIIAFALSATHAEANTYPAGPNNELLVDITISNPQNPGSTIFNQGDSLYANGSIQNLTGSTQTVSLSAITIGNNSVNLFPSPMYPNPLVLNAYDTLSGFPGGFTVNVPTNPALPQNFDVTFTAGLQLPIQHVFTGADLISAGVSGISNTNPSSLFLQGPGTINFTADSGTYDLGVGVDMDNSGSVWITDSDGKFYCANTVGADYATFSGIVFNNNNSTSIQVIKITPCP